MSSFHSSIIINLGGEMFIRKKMAGE